jgi:hypothetical protein
LERLGERAEAILVAARGDRALWLAGGKRPWRFHGGTGVLRIRGLERGVADPFLEACDLRPGDHFFDATGGACADALVAAYRVGDAGRVTVAEASLLLGAVIRHGVEHVRFDEPAVDRALSRMRVEVGDHTAILAAMPDRSVDVVYFDPMFREAARASPGFNMVRALADDRALSDEALAQALRVARRRVVFQDHRRGSELARLGIPDAKVLGRSAAVRFGVLDVGRA